MSHYGPKHPTPCFRLVDAACDNDSDRNPVNSFDLSLRRHPGIRPDGFRFPNQSVNTTVVIELRSYILQHVPTQRQVFITTVMFLRLSAKIWSPRLTIYIYGFCDFHICIEGMKHRSSRRHEPISYPQALCAGQQSDEYELSRCLYPMAKTVSVDAVSSRGLGGSTLMYPSTRHPYINPSPLYPA